MSFKIIKSTTYISADNEYYCRSALKILFDNSLRNFAILKQNYTLNISCIAKLLMI